VSTYYVNTDSVATPGTGATNDEYRTLAIWEAAQDVEISEVQNVICRCSSGTASAGVTLSGFTYTATDGSIYVHIYPESGYANTTGVYDTAKFRIETTNGSGVAINDEFVRLTGIQIKVTSDNTSQYFGVTVASITAGGSDVRMDKCIVVGDIASNTSANPCCGINCSDADVTMQVTNCIIYGWKNSNATPNGAGVRGNGSTVFNVYNCTAAYNIYGYLRSSGTMTLQNCIAASNDTAGYSGTLSTSYCADTGTSLAPGTGDRESVTPNFVNPTASPRNLLIQATSTDLIDYGDGTSMPTECDYDILATVRPVPDGDWDIGAHEYVAAGGASIIPLVMHHLKQMRY